MSKSSLGVKPLLVNTYEKVSHRLLTTLVSENGGLLLAKVRLADAVEISKFNSQLSRYALQAHLDFLVVDAESSLPLFAVEFDGKQHGFDPATIKRDRLKNTICELAGLPLLRISSEYLRSLGRWTVLSYAIESFYHYEAFSKAQEKGVIPWDEPYDFGNVLTTNERGSTTYNTLDSSARSRLHELYETKLIPAFSPDLYITKNVENGSVEAHAFMAVDFDRYLVGSTLLRNYKFHGIRASDIGEQLAVIELADLAERWLKGDAVACNGDTLAKLMHKIQRSIDEGGFISSYFGNALRAGGPAPAVITIGRSR